MNRGDIWTVNLRVFQRAIVVAALPNHPNVLVVPLRDNLAVVPTLLVIHEPSTGLLADIPSITGLDRRRLLEKVGHIDAKTMEEIRNGLTAYLDL